MVDGPPFKSKNEGGTYVSYDDSEGNLNGFYIEIYPIHAQAAKTSASVTFKAFLKQFDDQYTADFTPQEVFGRMDAIQVYRGTARTITLSWDVPSSSHEEAEENLKKCSKLMSYMYPVYQSLGTNSSSGRVMTAPPLFRIKFANLITNATKGSAIGVSAKEAGLLGTISGFTYSPDLDSGFFTSKKVGMKGDLLPQTISLSCNFKVIHDHPLGFNESGEKAQSKFPYGQDEGDEDGSGNASGGKGQRADEAREAASNRPLKNKG